MFPAVTLWYEHGQTGDGDVVRDASELDGALDRIAALSGPEWPALATMSPLDERFGPVLFPPNTEVSAVLIRQAVHEFVSGHTGDGDA
jgi:hypothetical protein